MKKILDHASVVSLKMSYNETGEILFWKIEIYSSLNYTSAICLQKIFAIFRSQ